MSNFMSWLKRLVPAAGFEYRAEELGFLPAVLEIQQTPPSPVGRLTAWLLMLLFAIAIVWAIVGKVDIVAIAHGKIIPSTQSKIIQPLETAQVKAIHVHEGQQVGAGDVLLELDTTSTGADLQNVRQQRDDLALELQRLKYLVALVDGVEANDAKDEMLSRARDELGELHFGILNNQLQEYRENLNSQHSSYRQKQSELASANAVISKLEQTLPMVSKRLASMEKLFQQKMASEYQYLEVKQQYIEQQQDLKAQYSARIKIEQSLKQIDAQTGQFRYEYKRTAMQDMLEKESRLKALEQEIIKSNRRNNSYEIRSPIEGTVQQLAINTVGGVVTPAQALMVIVPGKDRLQVEAFLENRDIGFVEKGQQAEIKIDAFPFTKYGVVDGNVLWVSNDAIEHEQFGLVFSLRADMAQSKININGKPVNLTPGMSVILEVKTGSRRIIDYIVRPIEEALGSSIKER